MKQVYNVFSCDTWHSHDSKSLVGVFTKKEKAIKALTPHIKKEAKKSFDDLGYDSSDNMIEDCIGDLERINQTQSLNTNFIIEVEILDKLTL